MAKRIRHKPDQMTAAEAVAEPFPLAEELKTYEAHLPAWADREGQFVLSDGIKLRPTPPEASGPGL
jgi:hypothetical protein